MTFEEIVNDWRSRGVNDFYGQIVEAEHSYGTVIELRSGDDTVRLSVQGNTVLPPMGEQSMTPEGARTKMLAGIDGALSHPLLVSGENRQLLTAARQWINTMGAEELQRYVTLLPPNFTAQGG